MIRFAGWVGAAAMVAAPPMIDTAQGKALAIVGLLLLTLQAAKLRAYNLILLNIGGIIGYSYALYF